MNSSTKKKDFDKAWDLIFITQAEKIYSPQTEGIHLFRFLENSRETSEKFNCEYSYILPGEYMWKRIEKDIFPKNICYKLKDDKIGICIQIPHHGKYTSQMKYVSRYHDVQGRELPLIGG
jgi:hypothetical protein